MNTPEVKDPVTVASNLVGYHLVNGALKAIGELVILVVLVTMVSNFFNWNLDPTDLNGWHKSGLVYYKDYGTGQEYIGDGHGALIKREPVLKK